MPHGKMGMSFTLLGCWCGPLQIQHSAGPWVRAWQADGQQASASCRAKLRHQVLWKRADQKRVIVGTGKERGARGAGTPMLGDGRKKSTVGGNACVRCPV